MGPATDAFHANRAITPSTDDAYNQFMKTKKVNPATKPLKNGGKALWIGRQSADNILVFFPGMHFELLRLTTYTIQAGGSSIQPPLNLTFSGKCRRLQEITALPFFYHSALHPEANILPNWSRPLAFSHISSKRLERSQRM